MSGTITVQGASHSGIVPIPSDFPKGINALLTAYLNGLSSSIIGGTAGFENIDVVNGTVQQSSVSAAGLEQFTNVDSTGGGASGGDGNRKDKHGKFVGKNKNNGKGNDNNGQGDDGHGRGNGGDAGGGHDTTSGAYTVSSSANTVIYQAPGNATLQGNGVTNVAIFGANSNVAYSDTNGGSASAADSIFAAGGNDSISTYSTTNTGSSYDIYSAGNDTISLNNQGTDSVLATGNARTDVFVSQGTTTVTASDNSSVWVNDSSSGTLDFINNSTNAATVFSSASGDGAALNSVTAFGGAGGGYYVGGRAGNNSLIGGTGTVTLQGAGNSDFLQANSSLGTNLLMAGAGNETLIGGTASGSNTFELGMNGSIASGLVSTEGSGIQTFLLGSSSSSTLTGSSAAGAINIFDIVRDSATQSTGPATYTISDFSANSALFISDSTGGAGQVSISAIGTPLGGGGAEILLGDSTKIYLTGVSASSLVATTDPNGTIRIT